MEALRSLLLHICVARTLKNLMAIEMRSMMKMNNFPTETPFKRLFVKFWNTLLLDDSIVNPKSKIYFWTQDIKREIEARCVCFSSLLFPLLSLLSGISGSHSSLFSLFVGCFFFSDFLSYIALPLGASIDMCRFPQCLSEEESSHEWNLHDALDVKFLLVLLSSLLHIR
jgi:hypothetical protein